jgi:CheY-like chemotaxis protein
MPDVLVVDDDPDIRTLLQIALERDGHAVEVAEGGTDGLAALREGGRGRPVVILDVQMPDLDGWQVLAMIREDPDLRDLPVILCTVRAAGADLTRGWLAGCDAYLPKPFDIADMASEVAALAGTPSDELQRRRDQRQLELHA